MGKFGTRTVVENLGEERVSVYKEEKKYQQRPRQILVMTKLY